MMVTDFNTRPFHELRVWADSFAQIQGDRIALASRLRAGSIPPDLTVELMANYKDSERRVGLAMRRSFRRAAPVLTTWLKTDASVGVGEHLLARLIGTIGHPVYAEPYQWEGAGSERTLVAVEPFLRQPGQLFAYCGYGDPTRKRFKGMTGADAAALGNPKAKMILRLIAESCIKCVGSENHTDETDSHIIDPRTNFDNTDGAVSIPTPIKPTPLGVVPSSVDDLDFNTGTDLTNEDIDGNFSPESNWTEPEPNRLAGSGELIVSDEAMGNPKPTQPTRRRSPYRDVYDHYRAVYATREGWTLLHQHNAALRKISVTLLKDLWILTYPEVAHLAESEN